MDPTEVFEAQRARLLAIAYGMLGSASDAEDIVQDAFREFDWVLNPDKLHRVRVSWH